MRVLALVCLLPTLAVAQTYPLTRAERSDYKETSHYTDVVDYVRSLQRLGAPVRLEWTGKSAEGREMPLVIASFPPVASAAEARRLDKPIVYIQANIHAGEVEGKEAALVVLRRLCQQGPSGPLGKFVLLMTPIYNIDGNEKFGPVERNRPEQDGPLEVGLRPNGMGLDLNRDAIKAESPEMRGLLDHVYRDWEPDIMMDLHTTDGTRHGWDLTYLPPTHPATEPTIYKFGYDTIIPSVQRDLMAKYKFAIFPYGDAAKRNGKWQWLTTGPEGRYCSNYLGLRNRTGILSEAATYIPFKDRIVATDRFVTSILDYVASHGKQIVDMDRKADATVVNWGLNPATAPDLAVRTELASNREGDVLLEKLAPGERRPLSGRPKAVEKVRMPIFDRYRATKSAKFPSGYLLPASATSAVELLRRHGIVVERLSEKWSGDVYRFQIASVKQASTAFQGHRLITLDGSFGRQNATWDAGSYLVRTAQPLGVLAFHILEPESIDGATAWGFLGEKFASGQNYPIDKVVLPPAVASDRVP